jgi:hypothetical protein
MPGRKWLLIGAVVGVAIALGHVPFVAGGARALADTALRLVGSGGNHLISAVADHGAPRRVVLGLAALVGVLAPGVTAMLLVLAARGTLRLRAIVALLIAVLGATSFVYQPHGVAIRAVVLGLVVAGIAVAATGPLVAAPLAALAGLIGGTYLPHLFTHQNAVEGGAVRAMHTALFSRPGDPTALRVALLVVAVVPFVLALRWVVRR